MYHARPCPIFQGSGLIAKIHIALLVTSPLLLGCNANTPQELREKERTPSRKAGIPGAYITFGVGSSSDFEGHWDDDIDYAWNDTWGFWNQGNQAWNGKWAYNLHGAKDWWESSAYFTDSVDSVRFFFSSTHGGAWLPDPVYGIPAQGVYAMWDYWVHAFTNNMYLGYNSGFFTKACDTQKNDGYIWDRWHTTFSGGLSVATGAAGVVYDDTWFTDDTGVLFANYIQAGYNTFALSWIQAVYSPWVAQYPSVMVSGAANPTTSEENCLYRLYNMTTSNMFSEAYYLPTWLFGRLCTYAITG